MRQSLEGNRICEVECFGPNSRHCRLNLSEVQDALFPNMDAIQAQARF